MRSARSRRAVEPPVPGLADILWRVVCAGEGMRDAETRARLARAGGQTGADSRARPGRGLLPGPLVLAAHGRGACHPDAFARGDHNDLQCRLSYPVVADSCCKVAAHFAVPRKGIDARRLVARPGFGRVRRPEAGISWTASPFRKMPAMKDGDFALAEFERDHPVSRSQTSRSCADPERPEAARKDDLVRGVCATRSSARAAQRSSSTCIVAPRFIGRPGDEEAARQAELNDLPPILDYLEKVVPERGRLSGRRHG